MIVVAGESLIDVVVDHDGDSSETPGGLPLNVAVGLARLDVPTTLISQVGHDERGGLVVQHVTGSGAEIVAVPTSTRAYVGRHRAPRRDRGGQLRLRPGVDPAPPGAPAVPRAARRLARHPARARPRERARPRRAGGAAATSSSATTPTCASRSSTTASAPGARCSRSGARCTLVEAERRGRRAARPRLGPRRRRPHAARAATAPGSCVLTRGADGATAFADERRGQRDSRDRSRWSTPSAPATRSWPATLAQLSDLDAFSRPGPGRARWTRRAWAGCCAGRSRSPRSRVSDAERTHLVDRSCLPAGPPDLLVPQRREHVVHHDRVDRHAAVAGAHLDVLARPGRGRPASRRCRRACCRSR